jgi:hypothetical protein
MRVEGIIMAEGGHNNDINFVYHGIGGVLGVEGGHMPTFDPLRSALSKAYISHSHIHLIIELTCIVSS